MSVSRFLLAYFSVVKYLALTYLFHLDRPTVHRNATNKFGSLEHGETNKVCTQHTGHTMLPEVSK